MDARLTDGPWLVDIDGDDVTVIAAPDDVDDRLGCKTVICTCEQDEHNEEIALLIAAAPELRSACAEMLKTLESPSRQLLDSTRRELDPWVPMLRQAIAKARGAQYGMHGGILCSDATPDEIGEAVKEQTCGGGER